MTEQQYFVIGDTYEDVMDSLSDVANISERSIAYKDSDRTIIFFYCYLGPQTTHL